MKAFTRRFVIVVALAIFVMGPWPVAAQMPEARCRL